MTSQRDERTFQETFPSSLDAYQGFIKSVLEDLAGRGWASELFGIEMALEETISNAIRHGNKLSSDKQVRVECRLSDNEFWAQVCDEGSGFKPDEVPDCRDAERLEIPGGRGLALICHYMSSVKYNDAGNCVTMSKVRGEDNGSPCGGL